MTGLIKTALCLHGRYLPQLPRWSRPQQHMQSTWEGSQLYAPMAEPRDDRRLVTADEYAHYQSQGFLVCKGLVPDDEVAELKAHAMDIFEGRVRLDSEYAGHAAPTERAHRLSSHSWSLS